MNEGILKAHGGLTSETANEGVYGNMILMATNKEFRVQILS